MTEYMDILFNPDRRWVWIRQPTRVIQCQVIRTYRRADGEPMTVIVQRNVAAYVHTITEILPWPSILAITLDRPEDAT